MSGDQRQSEAIRGHKWPSVVIRGNQRPSEAIRGHQRQSHLGGGELPLLLISGHQWSSVVISGHQRPSHLGGGELPLLLSLLVLETSLLLGARPLTLRLCRLHSLPRVFRQNHPLLRGGDRGRDGRGSLFVVGMAMGLVRSITSDCMLSASLISLAMGLVRSTTGHAHRCALSARRRRRRRRLGVGLCRHCAPGRCTRSGAVSGASGARSGGPFGSDAGS